MPERRLQMRVTCLSETRPDWATNAIDEFLNAAGTAQYPCFYAPQAHVLVNFAGSSCVESQSETIAQGLIAYINFLSTLEDPRQKAFSLFCTLFEPEPLIRPEGYYRDLFWSLVRRLRMIDPEPWPAEMPTNPDDPIWSFCFSGVPMFINANSPAHEHRRSRNLGRGLALIFQPRDGLDMIAPPDRRGDKIRGEIRARLSAYDDVPAARDLTTYGSIENRDWKLYFMPDSDTKTDGQCPLAADLPSRLS